MKSKRKKGYGKMSDQNLTKHQEILVCLAEECAEVAQECMKGLRFPESDAFRKDELTKEIADMMVLIDYVIEEEMIHEQNLAECKESKKTKLGKFSKHLGYRPPPKNDEEKIPFGILS